MWNGTMFVDLDWPLNASSLLSASAELLVLWNTVYVICVLAEVPLKEGTLLSVDVPRKQMSSLGTVNALNSVLKY